MSDGTVKEEISRRDAVKTAMKAGAYAAPVILAVAVPGAAGAQTMISNAGGRPTITGIAPASGPTTGGTLVTLTGTNFCVGARVTVNGVAATNVTVLNATTITFATPAGTLGAATVTVTCPGGTGTATFTYTAPGPVTVTGVTPNFGPTTGGTPVTITGTGFTPGSTVTFSGIPATGVTVVNPTTITATTPPDAVGGQPVTVTNPGGTGSGAFTFRTITPTGQAFGATASSTLGGVTLPPAALATLPPGQTITAASANLPGVVSTGIIADSALDVSNTTPGFVTAQSTSTVTAPNVLSGTATATMLQSQSTSTSNGITASSTATFSGIVTANGMNFNLATTAPNTVVNIPGVGTLTLNRVVTTTNGANSTQTATALSFQALASLGTGVSTDVASATSTVITT